MQRGKSGAWREGARACEPTQVDAAGILVSRRGILQIATLAAVLLWARGARAGAPPVKLQAQLLLKAAKYDRRLAARAGTVVRVLSVVRKDSAQSRESAAVFRRELLAQGRIGELPIEVEDLDADAIDDLAGRVQSEHVSIVFLSDELLSKVRDLATSLRGISVLTVAVAPEYVAEGAVLGFDLVEGRPKILVNLKQAEAQDVAFAAAFLKLAEVVE